ncbi:transmembrane protein 198-like [Periophthalmus magnuspinnatus]|uniref:transmembrane protein 198-like n=1 Tax=Periophthalmus magnuspinnatus TaxID=409849 RepID=UPI00145AA6C7|nr:transmembrane protein 198-like [Periophthalmus magnuspinnatus]
MATVTPQFVSVEPALDLAEDSCTLQINIMYEVIPSIVCSMCLSFGLIYCFFGYRCLKMVLFFSGFLFGSAAVLLLYHKEPGLDSHLSLETKAGIGLGVGVLCGLITMLVSAIGYILSGLQLGSFICLAILVLVGQFWTVSSEFVPVGSISALGIITAVFTLLWHKPFMVLYTSVYGAVTVMLCVDYIIGTFVLPDQVYGIFQHGLTHPLCWFDWVVIGICPLLSLIGGLVQWKWTARELLQKEALHKKQKKQVPRHMQRGRQPHRKRRPPPLKRYAGDVLAPSYIQSVQERRLGTGSSCSSISTITHTLIDFDFETGSMVPLTTSPVFTV